MKSKGNVLLIVILVIALVMTGVVWYFNRQKLNSNPSNNVSSPTSTPEKSSYGKVYVNTKYNFSLNFPKSVGLPGSDTSSGLFGEQISFAVSDINPQDCRGDCPVINRVKKTTIAGLSATRINGYEGEIGGCVARDYLTYVFQKSKMFIRFTLYATACKNYKLGEKGIVPLKAEEVEMFENVVSTFKFLEDTSSWKVLTNQVFKYSVRYPANWHLGQSTVENLPDLEKWPREVHFSPEKTEGEGSGVSIKVHDNPKNLSAKEWWENSVKDTGDYENWLNQTTRSEFNVDNEKGYYVQTDPSKGWYSRPYTSALVTKDNKIYEISTSIAESSEVFPIYTQMLSSFKFMNQ